MKHILLYRNIAISNLNIDIRIIGENIVVHRCIGVLLQPYSPTELWRDGGWIEATIL